MRGRLSGGMRMDQPIVTVRDVGPVTSMRTVSVSSGSRGSIFSGHSTRQSASLSKYSS